MSLEFSQQVFNSTLKELLGNYESTAWPRAINKHAFFVTLAALQETPADKEKIFHELGQEIDAKRHGPDGRELPGGPIPISIAIAAKRSSRHWTTSRQFRQAQSARLRGRGANELRAWRRLFAEKLRSMIGGRGRSSHFIKAGWAAVLQQLGPQIGGRYNRSEAPNMRGAPKGSVDMAEPGKFQVTIQNTANARTEHRGGFKRIGEPALERGIARENNQMVQRIEDEMKPGADKFNRAQH